MESDGDDAAGRRLARYAAVVDALGAPAAIVDAHGAVVHQNRWVEGPRDQQLLRPGVDLSTGACEGHDGSSQWRVRPIGDDDLLLATPYHGNADHVLRMFFSGSDLLFVVYNHEGLIVEANDTWTDVLGYAPDELYGVDSWSLVTEDDVVTRSGVEKELRETGRSAPSWKMRAADGTERLVQWTLRYDQRLAQCFGIGRELDADVRRADELHRRAYTDPLTGLSNRLRLVAELDRAAVDGAAPSVLFCDLDGFTAVNDSLGHRCGDQLLESLGRRLAGVVEGGSDIVARVGGDEFVVLLPDSSLDDALQRAELVLEEVARPFVIGGRAITIGVSIGVATATAGASFEAEQLLRQADMAAYEAKRTGRGRVVAFGDALRSAADRRIAVEVGLRDAIATGGIEIQLQPIVALPGTGIVGVEALMRWRDSNGELHLPGSFVDVAEAAGLMPAIGETVLRSALDAVAPVHRSGRPLVVSINASGSELAAPGFVTRLTTAIDEAGVDPSLVLLEVTEAIALADDGVVSGVLSAVQAAGVRVALDDFGTGHSSLWHLRRLPVDVLKIDRSFVAEVVDDSATRAIAAAIVGLCKEMAIDVIVEGVETTEQAAAVEQIGGSIVQGFLFHRPLPVESLHALLGTTRSSATVQVQYGPSHHRGGG
ncbi:MAG: bifunctional diguanylate cyclase/phosphodiesterase [Actinomycetota bacterium]